MLSLVLEEKTLDSWLSKVLKIGRVGVLQYGIVEYLSSPALIERHTKYEDTIIKLKAKGITLLSGPCLSKESAELCSRVLHAEFETRVVAHNRNLRKKGQEVVSASVAARKGKGFSWEKVLGRSRVDVALACESHINGLAFVTGDKKVAGDFAHGLETQGIITYTVDITWLKLGMTTSPPEIASGRSTKSKSEKGS
ncbi:hypothetical protein TWF730_001851 [Orbilia blumenaviensis]|uniref:DUF4411 family protein n=1 Tax=Orbilia blumenaviensis TaxID=1796055 RepID=A0AAV9UC85_9PEZI